MIDGQKRLVEATLEAARTDGEGKLAFAFVYDSSRFTSHLSADEQVRRCFKKRGSDGTVVDAVHDVVLELARQGVRCLDGRTDRQGLDDQLMGMLSRDDRALIGASSVAFVPKGAVFATSVGECNFHDVITGLARRGLVLSDGAIGFLEDNPHLWHDLLNSALDRFRPFIPIDDEARNTLRALGDAAIPQTHERKTLVVFNSEAKFRTAAAVAAAAHARSSVEINR